MIGKPTIYDAQKVPNRFCVEALCPEEPGSRGLVWKRRTSVEQFEAAVAFRVVCSVLGTEEGIFDSETIANDVRNNLNVP